MLFRIASSFSVSNTLVFAICSPWGVLLVAFHFQVGLFCVPVVPGKCHYHWQVPFGRGFYYLHPFFWLWGSVTYLKSYCIANCAKTGKLRSVIWDHCPMQICLPLKKNKKSTLTLFHGCWARTVITGFFCCLLWLLHVVHHVCLVMVFGLANTHSLSCQLFLMSKCPWCNFCITSFIRIAGIVISLALSSMPSATDNESVDGMPITICSALSVHFCLSHYILAKCCTDKNWLHHHMNVAGNLCFLV